MTLFDMYTEKEISQWKVEFKNEYGSAEIYPKDMFLYKYMYEYDDGGNFVCKRQPVISIILFVPDYLYGEPSKYDIQDLSQYIVSSYRTIHEVRGCRDFNITSVGKVYTKNKDQLGNKKSLIYWSTSIVPEEKIKEIFQNYIDKKYEEQYKRYMYEKFKKEDFSKKKNELKYLFPCAEG